MDSATPMNNPITERAMSKQLNPEDSRAVDLVMDGDAMRNGPLYAAVNNQMGEKMAAVGQVLHLLDNLSIQDPPPDLIARTLERIEEYQSPPMLSARTPSRVRQPRA